MKIKQMGAPNEISVPGPMYPLGSPDEICANLY